MSAFGANVDNWGEEGCEKPSRAARKHSGGPLVSFVDSTGSEAGDERKGMDVKRFLLLAAVTSALLVPASAASAAQCFEIRPPNRPTMIVCI